VQVNAESVARHDRQLERGADFPQFLVQNRGDPRPYPPEKRIAVAADKVVRYRRSAGSKYRAMTAAA
jgi:hypothetical protein